MLHAPRVVNASSFVSAKNVKTTFSQASQPTTTHRLRSQSLCYLTTTTRCRSRVNPASARTSRPAAPRARADPRGRARSSPRRRGRRRRDTSLGHRAEFGAERCVPLLKGLLRGGRRGAPQPLPGGRHERTRERLAPPLRRDRAARVRGSAGGAVPRETHHRVRIRGVSFLPPRARDGDPARSGVGLRSRARRMPRRTETRRSRSETRVERSRSWWTKTRVSS